MLVCGAASAAIAGVCTPAIESGTDKIASLETEIPVNEEASPEESIEQIATASTARTEAWVPSLDEWNLTHFFPDDADSSNIAESYAYDAFQTLMTRDSAWMSNIYAYSDLTPAVLADRLGLSPETVTGGYHPEESSHDPNDPSTWTIPSFRTLRVTATDGDGNVISPRSNVFEIISMANTYTYYQDVDNYDLFLSYSMALWELSHSYTVGISEVYYCSGCVGEDAQEHEWEELKTELTEEEQEWSESLNEETEESSVMTSVSEEDKDDFGEEPETEEERPSEHRSTVIRVGNKASASDAKAAEPESPGEQDEEPVPEESDAGTDEQTAVSESSGSIKASDSNLTYCPGHVDLIVHLKITGLSETANNLFSLDAAGNDPANIRAEEEGQWPGWTEETKAAARSLAAVNWYEQYGLSISVFSPGNPLTQEEIETYMTLLPDDISETRRELVRFALGSVGKVPYYWAGKASQAGYEGNQFGTLVSPDVDGRVQKGLDCSGWIVWVYWSVTGERLPYESTAGLAFAGTKISRDELLPGDIIIRTGSEAHVLMFLGWNQDGTVLCVNETSGTDNNVVVASREANWPYYRRLVD